MQLRPSFVGKRFIHRSRDISRNSTRNRRITRAAYAAIETCERRILFSSISGLVFNDTNANGLHESGEPGLPGWTVYIDQNHNANFDQSGSSSTFNSSDVPQDITPSNGAQDGGALSALDVSGVSGNISHMTLTFNITHPRDSDLTISLVDPANQAVAVADGIGGNGRNFSGTTLDDNAATPINQGRAPFSGTFQPANPLSGFNGISPNGTWHLQVDNVDVLDTGSLNSWSLTFGSGEPAAQADADGNYSFQNLDAGTYTVREVLQSGWTETSPPGGAYTVTVDGTNDVTGRDFGNTQPPGVISGRKFNDLNGNGIEDAGEPGLSGWTIYLDQNHNGSFDTGEVSTVTDASGNYSLPAPISASYTVGEVPQAGWTQTTPAPGLLVSGPNVNITRAFDSQSEGSIAVDPTNPNRLFEVSNVEFNSGLFIGFSNDGGATWTTQTIADGFDSLPEACCDPSAEFDSFGNLYLCYLNQPASGGTPDTVELLSSTDGGHNFTLANEFMGDVDQPTVTTGPGTVWVTWSETGVISAAGAAVTGLGAMDSFQPTETVGDSFGNFGDIKIGPTGQVMVTWEENSNPAAGPSTILTSVDPDGFGPEGFTQPSVFVTDTAVGGLDPVPAQSSRKIDAEAGLAWDRSGGPHNGRVYLVYTDELPSTGSGNTDIFIRHSDDNGVTWSPRVRVNDDATTRSQILPRIALDQTTGNIAVIWYDTRNDAGNHAFGDTNDIPNDDAMLYASVSTDGGLSFAPNIRVSNGVSNAADANNQIDFGDYIGLDFYAGRFHPLWADNSNSTGNNPEGALHTFDQYTETITLQPGGAGVFVVTAGPGQNASGLDFGNHRTVTASTIAGRDVFYNHGVFDGNDVGANAADDAAIATDKHALLPGQTATFANYTSYSRGLNGIMVDILGLPATATLSAADFSFAVGNSNTPSTWTAAPAPSAVSVRRGAGVGGSDRVEITWPDNAIQKQWLQVTVKADANTGLAASDVFYFGNAIGESGDNPANAFVNATDEIAARNDPHNFLNPATVTNVHDYNRDKKVDATDQIIARNNGTNFVNALKLITVPAGPAAAVGGLSLSAASLEQSYAASAAMSADSPRKPDRSSTLKWLRELVK